MRFDLDALRQVLQAKAATGIPTLFAAGSVLLAALVLVYGVFRDAGDSPADAVTVTGPLYTPVAATPPPMPATRSANAHVPDQPRFDDPTSVVSSVQSELKRAGCYRGPVNGVWSPATRKAMAAFTERVNARLPVDRPDPVLLALLQSHPGMVCAADCADAACAPSERPLPRKAEVASIETGATAESREPPPPAGVTDDTAPDAEDLGYSPDARRVPNPIASVQSASTESGDVGADELSAEDAAAAAAAGAAAHQVTKPKPLRTARKYKKKNSFSRQVSKGFRQIQRSLNKLF